MNLHIAIKKTICYNAFRQKHVKAMSIRPKMKPHELPLVGFLIQLFEMAGSNHQAHYRLDLIVKPFANIVSDYTCQNGD